MERKAWCGAMRVQKYGRVVDATDPGRLPIVDPHDAARGAALVLTEPDHARKGYILIGPEALTAGEQVAVPGGCQRTSAARSV